MYPTAHHTIGFPRRMSLDACAELCFSRSFLAVGMNSVSNLSIFSGTNGTKDKTFGHEKQNSTTVILDKPTRQPTTIEEGVTCQAFEYIVSIGYCLLLNTSAAVDKHGYSSLNHAVGTTYFELGKGRHIIYCTLVLFVLIIYIYKFTLMMEQNSWVRGYETLCISSILIFFFNLSDIIR